MYKQDAGLSFLALFCLGQGFNDFLFLNLEVLWCLQLPCSETGGSQLGQPAASCGLLLSSANRWV